MLFKHKKKRQEVGSRPVRQSMLSRLGSPRAAGSSRRVTSAAIAQPYPIPADGAICPRRGAPTAQRGRAYLQHRRLHPISPPGWGTTGRRELDARSRRLQRGGLGGHPLRIHTPPQGVGVGVGKSRKGEGPGYSRLPPTRSQCMRASNAVGRARQVLPEPGRALNTSLKYHAEKRRGAAGAAGRHDGRAAAMLPLCRRGERESPTLARSPTLRVCLHPACTTARRLRGDDGEAWRHPLIGKSNQAKPSSGWRGGGAGPCRYVEMKTRLADSRKGLGGPPCPLHGQALPIHESLLASRLSRAEAHDLTSTPPPFPATVAVVRRLGARWVGRLFPGRTVRGRILATGHQRRRQRHRAGAARSAARSAALPTRSGERRQGKEKK